MAQVLIIFGSESDKKIYNKIANGLYKNKITYDLRVLSAHRTPAEIDKIDFDSYSLIIAGAGLSAALPGVIAGKTIKPVIGVPINSNYQGLDALLSVMQIPPGIPVLGVGVDKVDMVVQNAAEIMMGYSTVTLIGDKAEKSVQNAIEILDRFKVSYTVADKPDKTTLNIEFTFFDEPVEQKDELVIYVPLLLKKDDKAEASLNLLKHSFHGLWVGLNNGKNAALAAVEILNKAGKYTQELKKLRKEMKAKVLDADKKA